MTQEEKELIKDLAARLPYGVICRMSRYSDFPEKKSIDEVLNTGGYEAFVNTMNTSATTPLFVRPYLRPMYSMTEEEDLEYIDIKKGECDGCVLTGKGDPNTEFKLVDWLNEHHFDYRGFIPIGLALEAPEGMYKTE